MKLNEEIDRIKSLMVESEKNYIIELHGSVHTAPGIKFILLDKNRNFIGETYVVSYKEAFKLSNDFKSFMESKNDLFEPSNTTYEHGLLIHEKYRKQGWATVLREECDKYLRENKFRHNTAIVRHDNNTSTHLLMKKGYKKYTDDENRKFFFKEL